MRSCLTPILVLKLWVFFWECFQWEEDPDFFFLESHPLSYPNLHISAILWWFLETKSYKYEQYCAYISRLYSGVHCTLYMAFAVEVHFTFSTFTSAAWRSGCAFVKLTLVASQMVNICILSRRRISGKDIRNVFSPFNRRKIREKKWGFWKQVLLSFLLIYEICILYLV